MKIAGRQQGFITVFVTLIMVPVVVITGFMVDVARLQLFASQASMAADAYGEAVLSEYDNVLKELYGLFSVTQNQEGLDALADFENYMKLSFNPGLQGTLTAELQSMQLSGFMPYASSTVGFSYETVDRLNTSNVMMTQISDYMKFRIIEQTIDNAGFFDLNGLMGPYEQIAHMENDREAFNQLAGIGDASAKVLEQMQVYYDYMQKFDQYRAYSDRIKNNIGSYNKELYSIFTSDKYEDYYIYCVSQNEIDAAYEKQEDGEELSDYEKYLAGLYFENADDYVADIKLTIDSLKTAASDFSGSPINFDNVEYYVNCFFSASVAVESSLEDIDGKITQLRAQLNSGVTEDVKAAIEKNIEDLEKMRELKGMFGEIYQLEYDNVGCNTSNKSAANAALSKLNDAYSAIKSGSLAPGEDWGYKELCFEWTDFDKGPDSLYTALQAMFNGSGDGDKNAAQSKIDDADDLTSELENELKGDEATNARDIPDGVMDELSASRGEGNLPGFLDYFKNGLNFNAVGGVINSAYGKFLLTEYDFGMFSSRVSGVAPEGEDTDGDEEYVDYSLNRIPMTQDINYLYGAELEYLLCGHQKSISNLNETRNIICGVRMVCNFSSTYLISELNDTIETIATEAAAAVAATGVGAAAAPLVRIAVSIALRTAVATAETVADWNSLKERQDVLLLKREFDDLECIDRIKGLLASDKEPLPGQSADKGIGDGPALSYEDYLHIMLFFLRSDDTLLDRTSDLITLNVNQSQLSSGEQLTSLDFKMSETQTAVRSSCSTKLDMIMIPDSFLQMFSGGSGLEERVRAIDDDTIVYSVIRGY